MTDLDLSPEQKAAVETLEGDVSISAGAGSGKTRVLVERFCRIVRENLAQVDEVLTVTFTEKAAKEMKERMVKRFNQLFDRTGDRRFEAAARRIETAYIGTIHSFAARVLRENAFEAKVDPQFGLLTEVEAETLKDQILAELFAANQAADVGAYIDLVLAYRRNSVMEAVKKLHGRLCSLGREAVDVPMAAAPEGEARRAAETYFGLIEELFDERRQGSLTGKLADALDDFKDRFPALRQEMSAACGRLDGADPATYAGSFDWNRYEDLASAQNFIDGRFGSQEVKDRLIKPAKEAAGEFRAALLAPIAEHYAGALKTVLADFRREYEKAKRRLGVLDFDDLLIKTKDLFYRPDGAFSPTADDYRSRFKFVMMDEFQDTNELQKNIVRAVCRPGRFFTVGDIKQSIYSFIHSDVSVFQKHHRDVGAAGGTVVPLSGNYRSRPEVIDFANWLFAKIWAEDADFDFEPLRSEGAFHPATGPRVELLLVEQAGDTEKSRLAEARAIAGRINQLLGLDGGRPLMVTKKAGAVETPRALRPGDILVLFRSTADIKFYEQALAEVGIDFYVVSGRGFYATHEVRDVVNLLKVIDNPLNDIAMASVLRSPMAAVSDEALWWLTRDLSGTPDGEGARTGKLFRGLSNLDRLTELGEADRSRLRDFKATLSHLHAMRSESKITRLIELVIRRTDYDLKLLASRRGQRKYANIRKLLETAEEFGARSLFSLPDFIRHVENMAIVADREGEAPTETEESPVVRLMTVHKAKGLEAPVVFVADCSRRLRAGDTDPFIFDKDAGLACKVISPLAEKIPSPSTYEAVSQRLKLRDIAEAKRLLYVAATRAEELLIFSGSTGDKPRKKAGDFEAGSWLGWLERALEISAMPDGAEALSTAGVEVTLRPVAGRAPAGPGKNTPSALAVTFAKELASGDKLPAEAAGPGGPAIDRYMGSIPPGGPAENSYGRPLVLSVTQAVDFIACPEKYRLKNVLGLEEPVRTGAGRPAAAAVGSAVHEVLASVDFKRDVSAQIFEYARLHDPALRGEILERCERFAASRWPARLAAAERIFQEVPFTVSLEGCRLIGRIDLLFKGAMGWTIADYKTGTGAGREGYNIQVGFYALALEKCLGIVPSEVALIGLGDGEDFIRAVDPAMLAEAERLLVEAAGRIRLDDWRVGAFDRCGRCGWRAEFCRAGCQ